MKNTIINALKNKFGHDARISLKLVGTVRYPRLGIVAPEYRATILYKNQGIDFFEEILVDTLQSRLDLEASPVEYRDADYFEGRFEDEELPF